MLNLRYSIIVEATEDPNFFGVHCPALDRYGACTAAGSTLDEAVQNGRLAIEEFVLELQVMGITPPPADTYPTVRVVPEGLDVSVYLQQVKAESRPLSS